MGSTAHNLVTKVADLPKGVYIVISDVITEMQLEDTDEGTGENAWASRRSTPRRIVRALLDLERLRLMAGSKPHPLEDIRSAVGLLIPACNR